MARTAAIARLSSSPVGEASRSKTSSVTSTISTDCAVACTAWARTLPNSRAARARGRAAEAVDDADPVLGEQSHPGEGAAEQCRLDDEGRGEDLPGATGRETGVWSTTDTMRGPKRNRYRSGCMIPMSSQVGLQQRELHVPHEDQLGVTQHGRPPCPGARGRRPAGSVRSG